MNPSDAEKHEMIDVISDWERLKSENANLRLKLEASERELSITKEVLSEEKAIVDRIWAILGNPTYEQLAGRSIYDLIKAKDEEIQRLRLEVDSANGWLNKYRAWFDGQGSISDLWEDPYMKAKNQVEQALSPQPMGDGKCEECDGNGYTSEHSTGAYDHDADGFCNFSCPVQVQCEPCSGSGKKSPVAESKESK